MHVFQGEKRMNKLKILWLDQFFDDYSRFTLKEYRKSETEIIEKLNELGKNYDVIAISVDEELTVDGKPRMFQFELIPEEQENTLKYIGWIDG